MEAGVQKNKGLLEDSSTWASVGGMLDASEPQPHCVLINS